MFVADVGSHVRNTFIPPAPCTQPIQYSIGRFDLGFDLTEPQLIAVASSAASVWNGALGKNLIQYSATGTFDINLVYDYRQQSTDELKRLGLNINDTRSSYDSLKAHYDSLVSTYTQQKNTLESLIHTFNTAQSSYEKEVDYWNGQGGAPKSQYDALQKEKASLNSQVVSIDESQANLNQVVNEINTAGNILNQMAHSLNLNVQTFNSVSTSTPREFEEGEYVQDDMGARINIYQFADQDKLLRVMEHEMGHALGLDHVADPYAVMYYLNEGSNEKLTDADRTELARVCGVSQK